MFEWPVGVSDRMDRRTDGIGTPMDEYVLAVDVGGTKLAAALVGEDGGIAAHRTCATPRGAGAEETFAALAGPLTGFGDVLVTAVGIGSAGPLDGVAGTVSPVNIPAWRAFPLRERVAGLLPGTPVELYGDGICAAAGEYRVGAGREARSMLGVVVSTGIGGGLVLDGRVLLGPTGNAGHVGHAVSDPAGEPCPCGGVGCLETIASGTSMVRWAAARGWAPARGPADAAALARDARSGGQIARRAFDRAGEALGAAVAGIAVSCDLDRVVVGGGVSAAWDLLCAPVHRAFDRHAGLAFARRTRILRGELAGTAGLVGAAALAGDPALAGLPRHATRYAYTPVGPPPGTPAGLRAGPE
jgi:glucokinase